jgi:cystathionine beta-synthase
LPQGVKINLFEKVTDKDAAIYTRKLAREEGIFAGNSCGAAIKGIIQLKNKLKKDDVVVVLLHDSGSRYIGKIYNDDWMKKMKFI